MVPADKCKMQQQIAALLSADGDEKETEKERDVRAQLMKQYNRCTKRGVVLRDTLRELKLLVCEIVLGRMRLQEVRQHVPDLHFRQDCEPPQVER